MGKIVTEPKRAKTKTCKRCRLKKPLTEFGLNRFFRTHGACDGRNVYCKACCRENMNQRRAKERALRELNRKPMVVAPRETPAEKVLNAIAKGHRTRDAIRLFTGLNEDLVCDLLAELAFDEEAIRVVRFRNEAEFVLAA